MNIIHESKFFTIEQTPDHNLIIHTPNYIITDKELLDRIIRISSEYVYEPMSSFSLMKLSYDIDNIMQHGMNEGIVKERYTFEEAIHKFQNTSTSSYYDNIDKLHKMLKSFKIDEKDFDIIGKHIYNASRRGKIRNLRIELGENPSPMMEYTKRFDSCTVQLNVNANGRVYTIMFDR